MSRPSPTCTIWVDVNDFFHYARNNIRPSRIQRVVYEILLALDRCAEHRPARPHIRFVTRGAGDELFSEVTLAQIGALFRARPTQKPLPLYDRRALIPQSPVIDGIRKALISSFQQLPSNLGEPLLSAGIAQQRAFRLFRRFLQPHPASQSNPETNDFSVSPTPVTPQRNDIFLVPGEIWRDPLASEHLTNARKRFGLRIVHLVHDLLPLQHPEWCAPSLVSNFRHWLETGLSECSEVVTVSTSIAQDLKQQIQTPSRPIRVMPMGSSLYKASLQSPCPGLPSPQSYVLYASPLEIQKNHALLLRVWRRLLNGADNHVIPTLVFAGSIGSLATDLLQQLDNADWFEGRIRMIVDPSDMELTYLYQNALFTVFPSLSEGWALPVTESLSFGTPCIASDTAPIRESGGSFVRYFDPENVNEATETIRQPLMNRENILTWKAEIGNSFHPISWETSANFLLDVCEASLTQEHG
ncbi:glycosyltransferase [Acetobacter sp.]|uniref:glycosyltransferase n=1 Tax=Acetobacter sp. TaxID=440 RepID=UPI0039E7E73F